MHIYEHAYVCSWGNSGVIRHEIFRGTTHRLIEDAGSLPSSLRNSEIQARSPSYSARLDGSASMSINPFPADPSPRAGEIGWRYDGVSHRRKKVGRKIRGARARAH